MPNASAIPNPESVNTGAENIQTATSPITVVKISGTLLDAPAELHDFWASVREIAADGPLVIVHGGGKQATALAKRLGHTPAVVDGRRITTDLDLDIVQWALCGKLNTQLVAAAHRHGLRAVGLSGADDHLLQVEKRPAWTIGGETVDFGWVGDVTGVDVSVVNDLLAAGRVPVIAPLGMDDAGQVYNVNADTVAQNLAAALGAEQLLLVTSAGGVCRDAEATTQRLDICDSDTVKTGVEEGWIAGGMRVKVETAVAAVEAGVQEAYICAAHDLQARAQATRVVL
jgi:acetylglutamate kinase